MRKSKFMPSFAIILLSIGFSLPSMAQNIQKVNTDIFPAPEEGYKRMVIEVPHSDQDANKRISFFVGKWMEVDGCNSFGLMGDLVKKTLDGWGYDYYVFRTNGQVRSTQMACPDLPKRNLFVSAAPEFVRYNGKMPIVIYVPEGYDVHFQIFKAEEEIFIAPEDRIKSK